MNEMQVRRLEIINPVVLPDCPHPTHWPEARGPTPREQFELLGKTLTEFNQARIPLPRSPQELWSHHKYSIMARNLSLYKDIGQSVSKMRRHTEWNDLAHQLTQLLETAPAPGNLRNALQHLWGYVSQYEKFIGSELDSWTPKQMLAEIQKRSVKERLCSLIR